ncbi:hypothetical protein CgunFtcFv8_014924 [Champsocephalus gunnari]|uniref:Uncharacterized protein n=1 Tax=Champsocephalus gunnari TaxID=52237 RepID=A0AAN8HZ72_CHAGU|nr:hypothetical protein CgunFtcFv8_014924 [Champsocephalus gunnari]
MMMSSSAAQLFLALPPSSSLFLSPSSSLFLPLPPSSSLFLPLPRSLFCVSPLSLTAHVAVSSGRPGYPPRACSTVCFSA